MIPGQLFPTAGVVRGLVPLGESPAPCLAPFHLHLETMALPLPLTAFQIGRLTWLDLHSLEEPHARSHWKTGPEPTSGTLTPTSLAHTPASRPESAQPAAHATAGAVGHTISPAHPAPKPFGWEEGLGRAFYPPGKTPEPDAATQSKGAAPHGSEVGTGFQIYGCWWN